MFKTLFIFTILISAVLLYPLNTYAESVENGKNLYQNKCTGCHDTRIHTRLNRIAHTYDALVNRVEFCDAQTQSKFSHQQLMDVVEYLNTNFYKFIK